MPSLVFEPVGPYAVLSHNQTAPSIAEWDAFIAFALEGVLAGTLQGLMVHSLGGGPNALQRRQLEMALRMHGIIQTPPAAILTDAWTARQITIVVSWFIPRMRAFNSRDTEAAMTFLAVPDEWRPKLIEASQRLQSLHRECPSPDLTES
jgi:hypothetical protein